MIEILVQLCKEMNYKICKEKQLETLASNRE